MIEGCDIVKQFEAWDERRGAYVVAAMYTCDDGSNRIVPETTRYTFDEDGRIVWIIPMEEKHND
jgi:CO/xanthine dehydrogenase Mo-binding subunit